MKTFTKETLTEALVKIVDMGWVPSVRPKSSGGVGNTLENLLGIQENNLPLPNAAEWELKCQRMTSSALTTLFHMEPSPRAMKFVPQLFLPQYGWHAGARYPPGEMSFRQTLSYKPSDRGFRLIVDRCAEKVVVSFNRENEIKRGGCLPKSHRPYYHPSPPLLPEWQNHAS